MSLNKIELSHEIVGRLYEKTLNISSAYPGAGDAIAEALPLPQNPILSLIVVFEDAQSENLSGPHREFLKSVLTACQQSIDAAVIFNISNRKKELLQYLSGNLKANCLMFDVDPMLLGASGKVQKYELQQTAGLSFIYASGFDDLHKNVAEKKKLWTALKQLFKIQ